MKKALPCVLAAALILTAAVLMTACGSGEKALKAAYGKLEEYNENTNTKIEYDEENDVLTCSLDFTEIEPDGFFDVLDKCVDGKDIGTLAFPVIEYDAATNDRPDVFAKRLGELPAKSLECLCLTGMKMGVTDPSWSSVLAKTDTLFVDQDEIPGVRTLEGRHADDLKNIRTLRINVNGERAKFDGLDWMTGLEEISFSAGLTKEQQAEAAESEFPFASDRADLEIFSRLKKLKRVLFYPELGTWKQNALYLGYLLFLDQLNPGLETNLPADGGEANGAEDDGKDGGDQSGGADELVKVSEIDVKGLAGNDKMYYEALEDLMLGDAENCYNKGKKFQKKAGKPKLAGKALVYTSEPFDRQFNKEDLYGLGGRLLIGELAGGKIRVPEKPHDYDTFIYIFPRYKKYGVYNTGTIAYATKTLVRVYDMKNGIRYSDQQVSSEDPPASVRVPGSSPERFEPNMDLKKALNYIKGL